MAAFLNNRWVQLAAGVVGMVAIANLQYGWTLFVHPIEARFHWSKDKIQVAFTLFIVTETWLVPLEAYLVDRFGPGRMVAGGGLLIGTAWTINSVADSLALFYLAAIIGGSGAGAVYGTSIGNALKWFPDRRGLAAGITAGAFGAGSALTVWPIQETIAEAGYEAAFLWFGLGQGVVVLLAALVLRAPPPASRTPVAGTVIGPTAPNFTPLEMVRTPAFWLLYVMMTMVTMGGLMLTAQLVTISKDAGVDEAPLVVFGTVLTALSLALAVERIMNGVSRPFFGWISDHIGRENTMFIAFTLEGAALLLLIQLGHDPVLFVLFTGLAFFAWGEIYSLFPALVGDMFGRKYATTNYSLMYTAKGMASLLVPLGNTLADQAGSWLPIFAVAAALNWITALLALLVLRPLRQKMFTRQSPG